MIPEIIAICIVVAIVVREALMAAINYHWWWEQYRCRKEPMTYELQRRAKKWWWVMALDGVCVTGALVQMLVLTELTYPLWARILVIVLAVLVSAFYIWLLFHLGGFAGRILRRLRG